MIYGAANNNVWHSNRIFFAVKKSPYLEPQSPYQKLQISLFEPPKRLHVCPDQKEQSDLGLYSLPTPVCTSKSTHDKTNNMTVCPAKTQISLAIRPVWSVFTVCMKKVWVLSYPLSAQRRLIRLGGCPGWSESSLGTQSCCWFCHEVAHLGSLRYMWYCTHSRQSNLFHCNEPLVDVVCVTKMQTSSLEIERLSFKG